MAALLGHLGEFNEGQEDWSQYAERVGHYLAANGIEGASKQRFVFLVRGHTSCWVAWCNPRNPEKSGSVGEVF